jgi:hypothetical protein
MLERWLDCDLRLLRNMPGHLAYTVMTVEPDEPRSPRTRPDRADLEPRSSRAIKRVPEATAYLGSRGAVEHPVLTHPGFGDTRDQAVAPAEATQRALPDNRWFTRQPPGCHAAHTAIRNTTYRRLTEVRDHHGVGLDLLAVWAIR